MSGIIAFTVAGLTFLASGFKIIGNALVGDLLNPNIGLGNLDGGKRQIEVDDKKFENIKKKYNSEFK